MHVDAPGGALVRAYVDRVVNHRDVDAVDELVAPRYRGGGHGWPEDRQALKAFYAWQAATRPDWRIEVQETVEVGEYVAVRAFAGGTVETDPGDRPAGAPERSAVEWLAVYRVEGGLITQIQVLALRERT